MVARLALGGALIMTTLATTRDRGVIESGIQPTIDGVTFLAKVSGWKMRFILAWST